MFKEIFKIQWTMIKDFLKFLCPHWYDYYSVERKVNVEGHAYIKTMKIITRKCEWCGKTQIHPGPMVNGIYQRWIDYEHDNNTIELKRL